MMNLSNKVALVTGSTSGIGLGIARTLAAAGTHIVLNGFGDKALIDKLVAEFRSEYKVKVDYSGADMSRPAEIAAMVAQAARELGGVDILVNNAGIQHVAPVEDFPLGEKQPSLEFATPEQIGAAALFLCSQAAAQIRGIALPVDGGWTAQ
jgi:NAD(P)-dependent dehydrogenase (short-subunit alcohol dehydrogenase family)